MAEDPVMCCLACTCNVYIIVLIACAYPFCDALMLRFREISFDSPNQKYV